MRVGRVVGLVVVLYAAPVAERQPVFRATVDLVRLDLLAVHDGQPVVGLTADDFEVFDNGVRQQIERVLFEEVPIDIVLAFDTSLSVRGEKLDHLLEASHAFLRGLRTNDRMGLMTFDSRVRLRTQVTGALELVARHLYQVQAAGSTSLLDAVYWSLLLPMRAEGRQVVLLFSDGLDNTSWLERMDVLRVVQRSEAVIYAVGLRRKVVWPTSGVDNRLLENLAEESGGRLFFADSSDRLRPVFERVLAELRTRYLLTYYPRGVPRPGWHTLQVKLKSRPGDVITRRCYLVPDR